MKDWVMLTVVLSIFSSVCTLLINEKGLQKSFRVLCAAVLILALIEPIAFLSEDISSFGIGDEESEYSASYDKLNEEAILSSVKKGYEDLLSEYLLKKYPEIKGFNVVIDAEDEEYNLKTVEVFISENTEKHGEIENMITSVTDTACEVIFINVS